MANTENNTVTISTRMDGHRLFQGMRLVSVIKKVMHVVIAKICKAIRVVKEGSRSSSDKPEKIKITNVNEMQSIVK
ncbi:hypothetical protein D3C81_1008910 [compost metagenome]